MKVTAFSKGLRECAPHVVAIATLAFLWNAWTMGAALTLGLIAALTRLRARTPTFIGQFITWLGGGAAAYALARTLDGRVQVEFASLLVGSTIARLTVKKPIFARGLDAAVLSFTLVAVGASREPSRNMYFAACGIFALTLLAFMSEAPHARILRMRAPGAIVGVLTAAALAAVLSWGTPKLTGLATYGYFRGVYGAQTGFSGRVKLDAPGELQTSDEVVMRIRGGKTDYLRGAVLNTFDLDSWSTDRARPSRFANADPGPLTVAMVKPTKFLFAPHGGIAVADGAMLDGFGATTVPIAISDFTIDPNAGAFDDAPSAADLALSRSPVEARRINMRLLPLAKKIIGDETDPQKQIDLISAYLSANYRYTLSRHSRRRETYQLMDFLFESKEGHCEFFASSMALLARTVGVATRIVTGFRVRETNKYGDYQVVREKHAHSWVEAYVPAKKSWITVDATPAVEAMDATEPDGAGAFADAIRERISTWTGKLAQKPAWLLAGLFVLTTLFFGRGVLAAIRARRKRLYSEGARPYFLALSKELADAGLVREPWEGLETFAVRVDGAGERDAAKLLRRYAAHRYGGLEDDASLARAFAQFVKAGLTAKRVTATRSS